MDTPGLFARLKQIALEAYARIVGLVLDQTAVDGAIAKAPGAARRPDAHPSTGASREPGPLTAGTTAHATADDSSLPFVSSVCCTPSRSSA